ncbi:MAG: 16S rRNA (adenine(1518)-N(6)/adenine(1519)-N(6))-dimethyltransferase RsmA [Caldicoprobacterales bacterium]|jgi:16S rRNA (adenine1518-N6/adenine1519-N6)-dimethyltransferase|nr:16S rRNA (adenine(1518)-N(6)/adenine(1519)-N(6))-dimethyltransferase RsmA [Clostridiales bacterium]
MSQLTSPKVIRDILERHNFRFSKSLGQNFLADRNIIEKIIDGAGVTGEDLVLEVGPGIGTLTKELVARAKKVVAIEIDKGLFPILEETLGTPSNLTLIHGDILKLDLKELTEREFGSHEFKVVANLPYYITTPIIMRFLEEGLPFSSITVMIQREVAQRMAAGPGDKEYGSLSVAVQYYTKPGILCSVPASVFIPRPKVDSTVVILEKRDRPEVEVYDRELFFRVVRGAFAKRRKILLNNLTTGELKEWDREMMLNILNISGIDPQRRGETLTIEEFARISNNMITISEKEAQYRK